MRKGDLITFATCNEATFAPCLDDGDEFDENDGEDCGDGDETLSHPPTFCSWMSPFRRKRNLIINPCHVLR